METDKNKLSNENIAIPLDNEIIYSRENLQSQNQNQIKIDTNPINGHQHQINFTNYPMGSNLIAQLMSTKYVRIYPDTAFACVTGCSKLVFHINTVIGRDDKERKNEIEKPLFFAEERTHCDFFCFSCCVPYEFTFEFYDSNNVKELFSISQITKLNTEVSECCKNSYIILAPIYNYKIITQNEKSNISRYDTRSFYRTYDYMGQSYYKIGEPYIPPEEEDCCCCCCCFKRSKDSCCKCNKECFKSCCCCCACCCEDSKGANTKCCDCKNCKNCCCCCCCCCGSEGVNEKEIIIDKRIYIDIFNMQDQMVGKFAKLYDSGCCCCVKGEFFYEVYFPPDANDILRLELIAQILFFVKFKMNLFGVLPGSRAGIEQWIN